MDKLAPMGSAKGRYRLVSSGFPGGEGIGYTDRGEHLLDVVKGRLLTIKNLIVNEDIDRMATLPLPTVPWKGSRGR